MLANYDKKTSHLPATLLHLTVLELGSVTKFEMVEILIAYNLRSNHLDKGTKGKTEPNKQSLAICRDSLAIDLGSGVNSNRVLLLVSRGFFSSVGFSTFHQVIPSWGSNI